MNDDAPLAGDTRGTRERDLWLLASLDALVVLWAVAFTCWFGAGDSAASDSSYYLNAAEHLARGNGYVTSSLDLGDTRAVAPVAVFAPGFPLSIALFLVFGLPARAAMTWSVAASFVLYALVTRHLLAALLPRRGAWLSVPVTLALLLQPAVRTALDAALSDMLGAATALGAAVIVMRGCMSQRAQWTLGCVLGLSVCVRWANLSFVLPTLVVLLLDTWRGYSPSVRALRLGRVCAPLALVVVPVWVRNWLLTGTLMGERVSAQQSLLGELVLAGHGLTESYARAHVALAHWPVLALVHVLAALALCGSALARSVTSYAARAAFGMVTGYVLLMAISGASVAYDPLSGTRFWLLVPPLITAAALHGLWTVPWSRSLRRATLSIWAVLALHATLVFAGDALRELPDAREPRGLFARRLDRSPSILRALALHDEGRCQLAANDAVALLPRSGTRRLQVVGLREAPLLRDPTVVERLCLLVVHEETRSWSLDDQQVYESILRAEREGRLVRVLKDEVAELWLAHAHRNARL